MTRQAGAVKYDVGALDIPGNLQRVALIELTDGDPVPPDIIEYDVEYYDEPSLIPPERLPIAAHIYTLSQAVPGFLRRVCAFVIQVVVGPPYEFTDGKSLKYNLQDNSMHIILGGF